MSNNPFASVVTRKVPVLVKIVPKPSTPQKEQKNEHANRK